MCIKSQTKELAFWHTGPAFRVSKMPGSPCTLHPAPCILHPAPGELTLVFWPLKFAAGTAVVLCHLQHPGSPERGPLRSRALFRSLALDNINSALRRKSPPSHGDDHDDDGNDARKMMATTTTTVTMTTTVTTTTTRMK